MSLIFNNEEEDPRLIIVTPEMIKEMEVLSGRGLKQKHIAAYFNMSLGTLKNKMRADPAIRKAIRRGKSKMISFVASKLLEQIRDGSTRATIYFLNTQGKWVETVKHEDDEENIDDENKEIEKLSLNTTDPNEAAKIYQQIMLGSKQK